MTAGNGTAGRWLVRWNPGDGVDAVLLCVPPAGSGCGQYAGWQSAFGPSVAVVGVQLPGRENRFPEPMPDTVDDAVAAITAEVTDRIPAGPPLVVYGQSFGGLLAYETCRRLGDTYGRWPAALVVAACRPPDRWIGAGRGLVEDESELKRLLDLRGLSENDLDRDSRDLMLDVLRADARLSLTYADPHGARLPCPVYAWGGEADEIVTVADLDGWAGYAAGPFARRQFPGGHHLPADAGPLVVDALRPLLVAAAPEPLAADARRGATAP